MTEGEFVVWLESYMQSLHALQKNIHILKIEDQLATIRPVAKKKLPWAVIVEYAVKYGPGLIKKIKWKK